MESNKRVRPVTVTMSSAFLLTVLILGIIQVPSCHGARLGPQYDKYTEFIRSSCNAATRYPELCFSSLSGYASKIQTSPTQLARTALSVSLASARSTSAVLSKASPARGMTPLVAGAMRDCTETLGDSVYELQESMAAMGNLRGKDAGFVINSIQTWVSAALTDDNTCMDGFAGGAMNGDVKSMVRSHVVIVAQLTSNALAFVSGLAPSRPTP